MALQIMYPDLAKIACAQVTFSADIRLSPAQVGVLRDTVLALFPSASFPWYFRELYESGDSTYEIAASVGSSGRDEPGKPYNVFLRILASNELGFEAPSVSELFTILSSSDELRIHCSANFALPPNEHRLLYLPRQSLHQDRMGSVDMESYSAALHDSLGMRLGTASVTDVGKEGYLCTISFVYSAVLDADLPSVLVNRAAELFGRIQRQ